MTRAKWRRATNAVSRSNFNDVKADDIIKAFEMEAILRKLAAPSAKTVRGQAAVESSFSLRLSVHGSFRARRVRVAEGACYGRRRRGLTLFSAGK